MFTVQYTLHIILLYHNVRVRYTKSRFWDSD